MPYYLDINPSNPSGSQYVTIPSITLTGDFTIEIDCEMYNTVTTGADGFVFSGGTSGGGFEFYRDNTAQNYRPSLWYNNAKNFCSASNVWPYASGSTANPRTITIQRVGGVVSSNFAGTAGTDVNIASGNNIVISAIGARPNGTFTLGLRLYRLRIYQGSTLVRDYNAANTSSGTILVDEVSGQNGTIQNPPAGNAQWVFYSSGASNTVTVSATLPKITGSLTLNEINPSYVISVSGQLPKITGAVTLNEISPVFTVAVAGQLPKLTGSIALNQFANNRQVTVNGVLPKLTGAVTLNRIQPNNQAVVSGQLPKITASITLRVPDSYPAANPNDYTVSAYISTDSTYTARLSESGTINAIISASSTFNARLN